MFWKIGLLIVLISSLILNCQQKADVEPMDTAAEDAAIKAVNEKQISAYYIAKDYNTEAEVWAHEPYIVHATVDTPKVGWEDLSKHYRKIFDPKTEWGVIFHDQTTSNYDIHLNGNVAFVFYDEHIEYTTEEGERGVVDNRALKYFEKKDGKWKMVAILPGESD